jgi:membrane-associated protein
MESLTDIFEFVFHLEKHLVQIVSQYGIATYAILFFIVFMETGFVITPFLPGDSLLFAAGALSSKGLLNLFSLLFLLIAAAILGDTVNYWVGRRVGPKIFRQSKGLLFNKEHLIRTKHFYEKYGAKAIVLARFLPIVRTFAPFVAGIGCMHYPKFLFFNVFGGVVWVSLFTVGGFYFGNLPAVQENFGYLVLAIIFLSILPFVFELVKKVIKSLAEEKKG